MVDLLIHCCYFTNNLLTEFHRSKKEKQKGQKIKFSCYWHFPHSCNPASLFSAKNIDFFSYGILWSCLPWLQEALDGIEFARGDPNSTWGSIRAAMGHPEPFDLRYVAIGNEDCGKKNYRGYICCDLKKKINF